MWKKVFASKLVAKFACKMIAKKRDEKKSNFNETYTVLNVSFL